MRKNKMMRAASALLVAVLLTTSTISGTFAKYVTQDSASDTARVAKWGVELQVVGNLFGENYIDTIEDSNDAAELAVQSKYNHLATDGDPDDVVAPGTKNDEGFIFSLKGTPEVAGKITTNVEISNIYLNAGSYGVMIPTWDMQDDGTGNLVKSPTVTKKNFKEFKEAGLYYSTDGANFTKVTDWNVAWDGGAPDFYTLEDEVELANNYYPVVFTLKGGTNGTDCLPASDPTRTNDTLKNVAKTIMVQAGMEGTAFDAVTDGKYETVKLFNPNTDLATTINLAEETITWDWAFYVEEFNDKADTILGMLQAAEIKIPGEIENFTVVKLTGGKYEKIDPTADNAAIYCLDLKFLLEITVEQIDDAANVVTP